MALLSRIAEAGADLERRLTAFSEDLNFGKNETEARGVKVNEVDSWERAAGRAIAKVFGPESPETVRWNDAQEAFRNDMYYAQADQRGKVAKHLYYFRTYLSIVQELSLLEGEVVESRSSIARPSGPSDHQPIKLFISHSSGDADVAEALIDLLRSALCLGAEDIRCTSVDGYRLPAGVSTDERLRQEVNECTAFIGLISERSMASPYVVFELGARWGASRLVVPLLVPGASAGQLGGPLQGINALSCESAGQLHQLVSDLGRVLGIHPEPASSYERNIEQIRTCRVSRS